MADIYGTSGDDTRDGTSANDNIYGYAQGTDPALEFGNDTLRGGNGADDIYGGGGNDMLYGDSQSDRLYGQDGNDTLVGGTGTNILDGGNGDDTFLVGGDGGTDTFIGGAGTDVVRLTNSVERQNVVLDLIASVETLDLAGFVLSGTLSDDNFDFSGLTNLINLGGVIDLRGGNDTYRGHGGVDTVHGGASNDELYGNGGDDHLYGDAGQDLLDGGDGDDTFWIGDIGTDTFLGGAGTDRIRLTNNTERQNFSVTAASSVELIDTNGFVLSGTLSYDNFDVSGLTGFTRANTTIDLRNGNDTYLGHDGIDRVLGGANTDRIETGAGNDLLDGGSGTDTLIGGAGNDTYGVDSLADTISESGGSGIDTVQASITFSIATSSRVIGTFENLTLTGSRAINATGNSLANVLTGNGGANILNGGGGRDTLYGKGGNDTYVVDATDIINERLAGSGGIDTVQSALNFSLASSRVQGSVENLLLTGTAITGTGNALGNAITGNTRGNALSGAAGNDTLAGKTGADRLSGGSGRDTFVFDTALTASNRDTIMDFSTVDDRIALDNSVFKKIGSLGTLKAAAFKLSTAPKDADDRIIYNKASGALFYDADGSGAAAAIQFATLQNKPAALSAADFVII